MGKLGERILLRILLSGQLPTENEKEVFVAFFATV